MATVALVHRRTTVVAVAAAGAIVLAAALVVAADMSDESESDPASADTDPGLGGVPSSDPAPSRKSPDPGLLLPDMRSLDARDLEIVGTGDDRRLRFAAWLANEGPGPLLVEPRGGPGCPPGQRSAVQVLHRDTAGDGVFQRRVDRAARRVPAGCMVDHPTHDHWHFDAMARYALAPVGAGPELVARDKVSFCLRDNTRVPGTAATGPKEYFGECARNSPQGISPSWVDVYDVDTPGQSLGLPPGTPDGVYCLTLEADPHGQLLETDETDNATAVPVRVAGTRVRVAETDACGLT